MPYSDKETVVKIIKESFEDTPYPGDYHIFEAVEDLDIPDFLKILRGKHWKETLSILEKLEGPSLLFYQTMFDFMTREALYYFTPAFLIIAMQPGSDMFGEFFLSQLDPNPPEYDVERFSQLMQLFSDRQKQAIALAVDYSMSDYKEEYLQYEDEDHLRILEYWSQWIK
jgi:hypothetical protein